jgi:hypothetical protein
VKWDIELGGEGSGEFEVFIGLGAAEAVMQVGGVEDQAEFSAAVGERAEEGYGICSAGEGNGEAQAGLEERCVDGESGAHELDDSADGLAGWVCSLPDEMRFLNRRRTSPVG